MDNIFTTVCPLFFVTKVFGLFPMTFNGPPEKGNLVQKNLDFIVPVLNVFMSICLIPLILLYPMEIDHYSPLMTTIMHIIVLLGATLILLPFFYQIYKRNVIKKFLLDLHKFDEMVSSL